MAKRVLVVAGRDGVAPALQIQIELWGDALDFTLAASGNEALWEIRGSPYDMVLAPFQLPEMTGMEFAEVVQALSPATKLVLIAVPVTPALQNQAEALHLYALLTDVSPQEVAVVVSRALGMPLPRPKPTPPPPPPQEQPAPSAKKQVAKPAEPTPVLEEKPAAPPPPQVELTAAQEKAVRRKLKDLLASIGPQVALLASTGGDVLVTEGSTGEIPLADIAAHTLPALSGRENLAQLLGDSGLLGLTLFTGSRYDIYAFSVTAVTALLLVFDKRVVEGKLGSVWLYTRKVVDELRTSLS